MSTTINVPTRDDVSPANQAIFDQLEKRLGKVPNLYATFAHSEHALGAYLALQNAKSSITGRAREVVNLVVSEVNACEYCLAAHTVIVGMHGFSEGLALALIKVDPGPGAQPACACSSVPGRRGLAVQRHLQNLRLHLGRDGGRAARARYATAPEFSLSSTRPPAGSG